MTRSTEWAVQTADAIRSVYARAPEHAGHAIKAHLDAGLGGMAPEARIEAVRELMGQFDEMPESGMERSDMMRLFGVLLGRTVNQDDLSSEELLQRLAESLNTIFDALNQLISVINMSLSGNGGTGDQTIRQFIGFHLGGDDQTKSLQEYLGQINKAFLTTHEAFKEAAQRKMQQVVEALSPEQVAKERGSGLKIGPLRKAEDYDIIKEKIERIQRWYDSGRFMEDFLREFEKNCRRFSDT